MSKDKFRQATTKITSAQHAKIVKACGKDFRSIASWIRVAIEEKLERDSGKRSG